MKKVFPILLALVFSLSLLPAAGYGAEDTPSQNVQFDIDGESYVIEVSDITLDDNGRPTVTLTSDAISGSISMSANQMAPFVACALLPDGAYADPILMAGGVVGGSGYAAEGKTALVKTPSENALGRWPDDTKGYLQYSFDTQEEIQDILIGTYADYSVSEYDSFLSSGVSSN